MKLKLLTLALGIGLMATSCKKEKLPEQENFLNIDELTVAPTFTWTNLRDVSFNIGISDAQFGNSTHVISIYTADPRSGGQLLSKGAATLTSSFNAKISLPSIMNEVFIEKYSPNGSAIVQKVAITSNVVSASIGAIDIASISSVRTSGTVRSISAANLETSPSCGCDAKQTITSNTSDIDLNRDAQLCITGSNITVGFRNVNGGNIKICGTNVRITGLKMDGLQSLIVTDGAIVTFSTLTWDGNSAGVFKNFGTATVENGLFKISGVFLNQGKFYPKNGVTVESAGKGTNTNIMAVTGSNFDLGGTFDNAGTLSVENGRNFNSNNTPKFTNSGTFTTGKITVAGTFTNSGTWINTASDVISFNNGPTVTNTGTIEFKKAKVDASGTFINNGKVTVNDYVQNSGKLENNCYFISNTNFDNNSEIVNSSYIQVDGQSNLKGKTTLKNGALFKTKILYSIDGTLKGEGSPISLFKVTGSSTSNINNGNAPKITGTVQFAEPVKVLDAKHIGTSSGASYTNGEGVSIEKTACNDGNGKPKDPDTDGDGIPDSKDDFDEDATKAFIHQQLNGYTVAFEDNFPSKGDYDLNDIVMSYRYQVITNAKNEIVRVDADYTLHATGGNYRNGAGIQFDIPLNMVSNVKGAEVEEQPKSKDLVLILFRDSRKEQATWNTIVNESVSPTVAFKIGFDVKPGIAFDALVLGNYNPFIWNATLGRGYETHLRNKKPTDFADRKLFQTGDDKTVGEGQVGAGYVSYVSDGNKPWAIELPITGFQYPIEKASIASAYLSFGNWAKSGGKENADWYKDGNIDKSKVFSLKK